MLECQVYKPTVAFVQLLEVISFRKGLHFLLACMYFAPFQHEPIWQQTKKWHEFDNKDDTYTPCIKYRTIELNVNLS